MRAFELILSILSLLSAVIIIVPSISEKIKSWLLAAGLVLAMAARRATWSRRGRSWAAWRA